MGKWAKALSSIATGLAGLAIALLLVVVPNNTRPAKAQQAAAVSIGDNFFQPKTITVPVGTTVVWTTAGQNGHTVTSDSGAFDSSLTNPVLNQGETFSFTFSQPGTFPYFCKFHGALGGVDMAGTVVVQAQPTPTPVPTPTATPTPAPTPTPTPAPAPGTDWTRFGFPRVTASTAFTPGQATSLVSGNQRFDIPANALARPARFEFLEGDVAFFQGLTGEFTVLTTFALRVTDLQSGQLVRLFENPVRGTITDPRITPRSTVLNATATSPPSLSVNPAPKTIRDQTLSQPFPGAVFGWLTVNPVVAAPALPARPPVAGIGPQAEDVGTATWWYVGAVAAGAALLAAGSFAALRRARGGR